MSLPVRQRLLLECLLAAERPVSLSVLAREMGTSARTMRRSLPALEVFTANYGVRLEKKTRAGICLAGETAKLSRLRDDLSDAAVNGMRPAERQFGVVARLLAATGRTKLRALALDLQVTVTTVTRDLLATESWFAAHGLRVVRKRGCGLWLDGPEENRRRAIADFLVKRVSEAKLIELMTAASSGGGRLGDALLESVFLLINRDDFQRAGEALYNVERDTAAMFTPSASLEIGLQLALAGARMARFPILDGLIDRHDYAGELRLAKKLLALVQRDNAPPLPNPEIAHIALQLRGAKRREPPLGRATGSDTEILDGIRMLLAECDRELGSELSANSPLVSGLLAHLKPAFHRLAHHMPIRNALLPEIRQEYEALFSLLAAAAGRAFSRALPDEEIGYLVMHIGAALERRRKRCRALVVCAAGIGTSRMLASRLRTELPDMQIVDELSWLEAERRRRDDYDVILSTVALPPGVHEHIVVHPLLPPADLQRVRTFIHRHHAIDKAIARSPSMAPCS
jgi:mannitol operon transcriptional antiterminator